jgi:hypothetical protein
MTLIGVDVNATRARAVSGPSHGFPLPCKLEEEQRDLPLVVSLAERRPVAGRAGLTLCRTQPHLAAVDFLPQLGSSRKWTAGRHSLDAAALVGVILDRLQRSLVRPDGVALAVPAYLLDAQITQIGQLAEKARLPLLCTVPGPLAAARWAFQRRPWSGVALVGDVDGGSFTWSAVAAEGTQARLLEVQSHPRLNRSAWLMRLLDAVAGRCIRLSRRDPRQVPETEQALFNRLSTSLDVPLGPGLVEINLRTSQWSQHLLFQPADLIACCAPLVQQTIAALRACSAALPSHAPVQVVLLTSAAGCLPGLVPALETVFTGPGGIAGMALPARQGDEIADFGEGLCLEGWMAAGEVQVLDADALAVGAHDLAGQVQRGEAVRGQLDCVRLPVPEATDEGPARLMFRGQEHPLVRSPFTLGQDPECNLVIEGALYPAVAPHHCDIVLDQRVYTLYDRSRQGTLINDQPVNRPAQLHSGDWIRLGPEGPVLRFLGQATSLRPFRAQE